MLVECCAYLELVEEISGEEEQLHSRQRLSGTLTLADGKRNHLFDLFQLTVFVEEAFGPEALRLWEYLKQSCALPTNLWTRSCCDKRTSYQSWASPGPAPGVPGSKSLYRSRSSKKTRPYQLS